MSMNERLRDLVEPLVTDLGLELFDLDFTGSNLVITVDRRPAPDRPRAEQCTGVGIDDITTVTRAVSRALDEHDPIPGAFTLEVSSPGLERPLRVPRHYQWAVGQKVTIKTVPGFEPGRRLKGELVRAGSHDRATRAQADTPMGPRPVDDAREHSIELQLDEPAGLIVTIPYDQIERARTVFEWGPTPKPSKPNPAKTPKAPKTPKAKSKPGKSKSGPSKVKPTSASAPKPGPTEKKSQHKKVTAS